MKHQCPKCSAPHPRDSLSYAYFGCPVCQEMWLASQCVPLEDAPQEAPPADAVNHPAHYTAHPSGVECITITEHMTFSSGNAVKYLWRAGLKGNGPKHIEDLKKARWYVDREIARLEAAKTTP